MRVVGYVVHGGGVLDVLRRGLVEQAPVQEVDDAQCARYSTKAHEVSFASTLCRKLDEKYMASRVGGHKRRKLIWSRLTETSRCLKKCRIALCVVCWHLG